MVFLNQIDIYVEKDFYDEDIIDEFPKYYDSLLLTDKQLDDFSKQMVYTEAIPSKTRKKFLYTK